MREGAAKVVRKATAQDVADLAGVSRSAVSLVLNGRGQGNIAPDKQQAIIAAARQLNYTPNAVALSLRNRRSRIIGVLTWPGASGFAERMLHAALQAATRAGYLLIFMDTANDRDHQGQALATLHDHQVDGLLVIAPDLIEYRPVEVMSSIQTILVNCLDPSASLTTVAPDEYGAGSAAARVLIEAGHTSIGVVAEASDKMQNRLRLAGIQATTTGANALFGSDGARPGHGFRLRRGSYPAQRGGHTHRTDLHSRTVGSWCPACRLRAWAGHSNRPVDCQPGRRRAAGLTAGSAADDDRAPRPGHGRAGRDRAAAAS
jgi:transcriptional regulator with XRE-family HTH domain